MASGMKLLEEVRNRNIRTDLPDFSIGDRVKVYLRIKEGDKERLQFFLGDVTRMRGGGVSATFTVRKISYGVGVEKVIPFQSPTLEKIELVQRGRVRRAKLYYLRQRTGKAARIREDRDRREADLREQAQKKQADKDG